MNRAEKFAFEHLQVDNGRLRERVDEERRQGDEQLEKRVGELTAIALVYDLHRRGRGSHDARVRGLLQKHVILCKKCGGAYCRCRRETERRPEYVAEE